MKVINQKSKIVNRKSKIVNYFMALLLLSGCNYLDYTETSFGDYEETFSDYNRTMAVINACYSQMEAGFSLPITDENAMLESATDNSMYVWENSIIRNFYNGSWSPKSTYDAQWSACYNGIRKANLFLENARPEVLEEFKWTGNGYKTKLFRWSVAPNEARFLRAFFHFELAKRYGDIPLVTKVLTLDEANKSTRNSFQEVIEWIAQECAEIAPNLPVTYRAQEVPDKDTGRATQGAALALRARALLYLASPLHNPASAPDYQQKWINAAKAAHDLIKLNIYPNFLPAWGSVFNNWRETNTELIFERRQANSRVFETANTSIGFALGRSGNCPTQNLVDAFEMKTTGKGILEEGSGYNPDAPYTDRDPRLDMTVLYHKSTGKSGLATREMDMSFNGVDGKPKIGASPTGYYLKKYMVEGTVIAPPNETNTEHCWIFFRYAEVLLNFAEAMNEAYGPNSTNNGEYKFSAIDAANYVRRRPGVEMPLILSDITQNEFRDKIRNERRVELAFEGHRAWDMRRWKQGDLTKSIRGMNIVKEGTVTTYTPATVQTRIWEDKMYFYPIPQVEIYNTKGSLVQNPGWQ